jgi:hypothetical protein
VTILQVERSVHGASFRLPIGHEVPESVFSLSANTLPAGNGRDRMQRCIGLARRPCIRPAHAACLGATGPAIRQVLRVHRAAAG